MRDLLRLLGTIAVVVAFSGCIASRTTTCSFGVCAEGHACDEVNERCVLPTQAEPCVGLIEAESCAFDGASGACRNGYCYPFEFADDLLNCECGGRRAVVAVVTDAVTARSLLDGLESADAA